jgi:hypothetical protein
VHARHCRTENLIDQRLAEPDAYKDSAAASALARERSALAQQRDLLEETWIELGSQIEALDQGNAA